MKLHLNHTGALNSFTAYGDGFVEVNSRRFTSSIVVSGTHLEAWHVTGIASLDADSFARALEIGPDLILIGSGSTFRFPSPKVLRPLIEARIGHEVMDTHAACRTYNILLGEGRNVLAALIVA
jgi:uncharacterized protein